MNVKGKKIVMASSLAVVLIGSLVGGILFNNRAFAESRTSLSSKKHALPTASRNTEATTRAPVIKLGGGISVNEIAALLGTNESALLEQMKKGKSLAQLVHEKGINQDEFLQKMLNKENQKYDTAVREGKMKQAQADKLKSGLTEQLRKMMENSQKNEPTTNFVVNDRLKEAGTILGIDQQLLMTELKHGRSLRQIAVSVGINEDDLLNKLMDIESRNIENALKTGKIKQDQADKMKTGLKGRLKVFLNRRT